VTVGIVAICRLQYGAKDTGFAIIGASDRMLTNGDVQFEPPQMKFGALGKRITVVTAGEVHIHTEALRATQRDLLTNSSDDVNNVAEIYAANMRAVTLRLSAQRYLAPHGLDEVSFLSAQRGMNQQLVMQLTEKMERCDTDAEAIIAGIDNKGVPQLCYISPRGIATCHSDEGFRA